MLAEKKQLAARTGWTVRAIDEWFKAFRKQAKDKKVAERVADAAASAASNAPETEAQVALAARVAAVKASFASLSGGAGDAVGGRMSQNMSEY